MEKGEKPRSKSSSSSSDSDESESEDESPQADLKYGKHVKIDDDMTFGDLKKEKTKEDVKGLIENVQK